MIHRTKDNAPPLFQREPQPRYAGLVADLKRLKADTEPECGKRTTQTGYSVTAQGVDGGSVTCRNDDPLVAFRDAHEIAAIPSDMHKTEWTPEARRKAGYEP